MTKRVKRESLEQDIKAVQSLLKEAVGSVNRPESLSATALRSLIATEKMKQRSGIVVGIPRGTLAASACAVAGAVAVGALAYSGKLQLGFSAEKLGANTVRSIENNPELLEDILKNVPQDEALKSDGTPASSQTGQGAPQESENAAAPQLAMEEGQEVAPLPGDELPLPGEEGKASLPQTYSGGLRAAGSYDDILNAAGAAESSQDRPNLSLDMGGGSAKGFSGTARSPLAGESDAKLIGAAEPDTLKSDSESIFYVAHATGERKNTTLYIVSRGEMQMTSALPLEGFVGEVLLSGNRLITLTQRTDRIVPEAAAEKNALAEPTTPTTELTVYDIVDRANPVKKRTFTQEGAYLTATLSGENVAVVTVTDPAKIYSGGDGGPMPLPRVFDSASGASLSLSPDKIFIPDYKVEPAFTVVSAVPLSEGAPSVSAAVMGGANSVYNAGNRLYMVAESSGRSGEMQSEIHALSLSGSGISPAGTAAVPGVVSGSASVDVYNGNLRVAATFNSGKSSESGVYIFDSDMKPLGSVTGIGVNSGIYGARFLGDWCYLFSQDGQHAVMPVNLSDPKVPVILGQQRLAGMAGSMFNIGGGRAVSLWYDSEITDSGAVKNSGLKLTLFDLSSPGKPNELDTVSLGSYGSLSLACTEPRAFYSGGGELGFPLELISESGAREFTGFITFKAEGGKLLEQKRIMHPGSGGFSYLEQSVTRGVLLDNAWYTATESEVMRTDNQSGAARTVKLKGE